MVGPPLLLSNSLVSPGALSAFSWQTMHYLLANLVSQYFHLTWLCWSGFLPGGFFCPQGKLTRAECGGHCSSTVPNFTSEPAISCNSEASRTLLLLRVWGTRHCHGLALGVCPSRDVCGGRCEQGVHLQVRSLPLSRVPGPCWSRW